MADMKSIIDFFGSKKHVEEQGHFLYVIMRKYDVEDLNEDDENW